MERTPLLLSSLVPLAVCMPRGLGSEGLRSEPKSTVSCPPNCERHAANEDRTHANKPRNEHTNADTKAHTKAHTSARPTNQPRTHSHPPPLTHTLSARAQPARGCSHDAAGGAGGARVERRGGDHTGRAEWQRIVDATPVTCALRVSDRQWRCSYSTMCRHK